MRTLPILACLTAWLGSTAVQAQEPPPQTIWESPKVGRWTVKAIRNGWFGPAQCLMSNIGDGSGVAYAITPDNVQRLAVQNSQWRIPAGTAAVIYLQIDHFGPWEVKARRSPSAVDTVFIEARFDAEARRLLEQMRQGTWLHIVFPSGQRYEVSLEGSKLAGGYLLECYERFGKLPP